MEENKTKTKLNKNKYIFVVILLTTFLFAQNVLAATIYPSPSTGSYKIGQTFSVGVYVSSSDQAMNAVSGTFSFPANRLQVTSISKSGSVVNLWVQEPGYSNSNGTVNFEGIILNPGFKGSNGKVITINFKTKSSGNAKLTFSSGSVLANDGQGTNILTGLGSASFNINVPLIGPGAGESETPMVTSGVPAAPQIFSETHPNPDSWYSNNTPHFSWLLARGVTGTRLLVGSAPQATPSVSYVPAISSRQLEDVSDGIWYFHVRLSNASGWGNITHFRFQVDATDPELFSMETVDEEDLTTPTRSFIFDSHDEASGISHYEVQIDDGEPEEWLDDGSHIYTTPILGPGSHTLIAKAVDRAGNFLTNFSEFRIEPIEAPVITEYPKELPSNEIFVVKGKSYPNSQVVIWLQAEHEAPFSSLTTTDEKGNFTHIHEDRLDDGIYNLWAEAIDERGARSEATKQFTVMVSPSKFIRIGSLTVSVLSVLVPFLAIVFFMIFMTLFSWRKLRIIRRRVTTETLEAEAVLHKEFDSLKKKIRTHIKAIEKVSNKRKLSKEETKIVNQLKKDLDSAEKKVQKEIKDIEKEVK